MDQGSTEHDLLLHSLGELVHALPAHVEQIEQFQELIDSVAGGGEIEVMERANELEVLVGAEALVERTRFGHIADAGLDLHRLLGDAVTGHQAVPEVGANIPVSIFTVVDLPAPFGPRNPKISPGCTSRDRPSTALLSPNTRVRFSVLIIGSPTSCSLSDGACMDANGRGSSEF